MAEKEDRRNSIGGVRRAIRALQEIPAVLSLVVLLTFLSDTMRLDLGRYLCPVFGFSLYVLARLYMVSRRLYVSRWARVLYLMLMCISLTVLADEILGFTMIFVEMQEMVFSMFITGVIVSLITFIYDKWRFRF